MRSKHLKAGFRQLSAGSRRMTDSPCWPFTLSTAMPHWFTNPPTLGNKARSWFSLKRQPADSSIVMQEGKLCKRWTWSCDLLELFYPAMWQRRVGIPANSSSLDNTIGLLFSWCVCIRLLVVHHLFDLYLTEGHLCLSEQGALCPFRRPVVSDSSEKSQLRCLGASLCKCSGQDKLGRNSGHTPNTLKGLHIPSVLGALKAP